MSHLCPAIPQKVDKFRVVRFQNPVNQPVKPWILCLQSVLC